VRAPRRRWPLGPGTTFLGLFLVAASLSAQSFTLPLPGTLVRAAAVTGPGGRSGVALLVAARPDKKGAKTLLFLDPQRRSIERLAAGLDEEVNSVTAFDLAGNGAAVAIAGMQGGLFTPAGGEKARQVLEEPYVDLLSVAGDTAGRPWIPAARTGLLELLGPATPGGPLGRRASFPLPVRAERPRWGLRLASPPVTLLPGEPPVFTVGPEEVGRRRIKTLLLQAIGGEPTEAWSLLPADERLTSDRRYLRLDGTPALAATTFGKIGVFAKKRFRLFLLGRDRSRKGTGPNLAFETDCPLWYPLDAYAADADGDGRQDLILVHPGGLRGRETQVSAYRGLGAGKFDPEPRRWKLNDQPRDWLYGPDLTGDGVPDFLLLVKNRLFLYAGDPKGSRPLAARPVWAVTVAGLEAKGPRSDELEGGDEESLSEDQGPERERLVQGFALPGGGRLVFVQGFQKDGRSVLTVISRK
jgi:VCBS repeat protein